MDPFNISQPIQPINNCPGKFMGSHKCNCICHSGANISHFMQCCYYCNNCKINVLPQFKHLHFINPPYYQNSFQNPFEQNPFPNSNPNSFQNPFTIPIQPSPYRPETFNDEYENVCIKGNFKLNFLNFFFF